MDGRREADALALLLGSGQPERVVEHCKAVAALSGELAERLNKAGLALNVDLCRRGGLLHDVCRTERRHAEAGARYLAARGLMEEAEIARVHLGDLDPERIDERAVVCLADKLISGCRRCTVEERFARSAEKYRGDPAVEALLRARRETALRLLARIEALLGEPV